jgi:hypothetical protein
MAAGEEKRGGEGARTKGERGGDLLPLFPSESRASPSSFFFPSLGEKEGGGGVVGALAAREGEVQVVSPA